MTEWHVGDAHFENSLYHRHIEWYLWRHEWVIVTLMEFPIYTSAQTKFSKCARIRHSIIVPPIMVISICRLQSLLDFTRIRSWCSTENFRWDFHVQNFNILKKIVTPPDQFHFSKTPFSQNQQKFFGLPFLWKLKDFPQRKQSG